VKKTYIPKLGNALADNLNNPLQFWATKSLDGLGQFLLLRESQLIVDTRDAG